MKYPREIWADTDLVCSDSPVEGWQKYTIETAKKRYFIRIYSGFFLRAPRCIYNLWPHKGLIERKAERPGPMRLSIATETRWPGSLQRFVGQSGLRQ